MILNTIIPAAGKNICVTAANASYAITAAFFCNISQTAIEILNLYVVSKGSGIGPQSQIISNLSINPADTFVLDTEKIILEDGDIVYATSNGGNLSAVVSVMDIS